MDYVINTTIRNNLPVLQQLNNGFIPGNVVHAMPMKITTSDNAASFKLGRSLFGRAYQAPVNYSENLSAKSTDQIKRQSPAIHNGFLLDGPKTAVQKKWIGGNKDASNAMLRRKMNNTGAIMNAAGAQSFKAPTDNNPRIDALARVRGGGARVPVKVGHRNLM